MYVYVVDLIEDGGVYVDVMLEARRVRVSVVLLGRLGDDRLRLEELLQLKQIGTRVLAEQFDGFLVCAKIGLEFVESTVHSLVLSVNQINFRMNI